MKTWGDVRYFRPQEFESPDAPGSGVRMDLDFVLVLDELRRRLGFPLLVRSGYRTPAHNAKVSGAPNSAHLKGWAADIAAVRSGTRFRIVEESLKLGIVRIGLKGTFVHLDVDPGKPQGVLWLY